MANIYNDVLDGVLAAYVSVINPLALRRTRTKQIEELGAWLGRQFTTPQGAGLRPLSVIVQRAIDCEGAAVSPGKRTNALLHAHQALKALAHLENLGMRSVAQRSPQKSAQTIDDEISEILSGLL